MNEKLIIFFHAVYVGFAFGVLFFGALVFRQVVDKAEVRKLHMGEDKDAFVDGGSAWVLIGCLMVLVPIAILCYGVAKPSIYVYALPLVLAVQLVQLALRMVFQRTLVKTRGIVVQSVLLHRFKVADFSEILVVRLIPSGLWVTVRIALPDSEAVFRIFSSSVPAFEQLMSTSCRAPVLWLKAGAGKQQRHKPNYP